MNIIHSTEEILNELTVSSPQHLLHICTGYCCFLVVEYGNACNQTVLSWVESIVFEIPTVWHKVQGYTSRCSTLTFSRRGVLCWGLGVSEACTRTRHQDIILHVALTFTQRSPTHRLQGMTLPWFIQLHRPNPVTLLPRCFQFFYWVKIWHEHVQTNSTWS